MAGFWRGGAQQGDAERPNSVRLSRILRRISGWKSDQRNNNEKQSGWFRAAHLKRRQVCVGRAYSEPDCQSIGATFCASQRQRLRCHLSTRIASNGLASSQEADQVVAVRID